MNRSQLATLFYRRRTSVAVWVCRFLSFQVAVRSSRYLLNGYYVNITLLLLVEGKSHFDRLSSDQALPAGQDHHSRLWLQRRLEILKTFVGLLVCTEQRIETTLEKNWKANGIVLHNSMSGIF
jgi:hypothetical protein